MIGLSWSTHRGDPEDVVEHLEPKPRAHLARHAGLGSGRDHTANQFGDRRKESERSDPKHWISGAEIVKHACGSTVHRACAPSERPREDSARRGQHRVAGRMHQSTRDDGETQ